MWKVAYYDTQHILNCMVNGLNACQYMKLSTITRHGLKDALHVALSCLVCFRIMLQEHVSISTCTMEQVYIYL